MRPMRPGGKPSPSSVIRTMIRWAVHSPSTQTVERAKSTAFCTRFRSPWITSGRRRIRAVRTRRRPVPGRRRSPPACRGQMRLGGFAQDGRQRGLPQVQVVLPGPPHVAQDVAAAVGLVADQAGVLLQVGMGVEFLDQFGADQLDRGQRRPSSCAAAATTPARSVSFCSRAKRHLRRQQRLGHRRISVATRRE
jgi:hypothetical protein